MKRTKRTASAGEPLLIVRCRKSENVCRFCIGVGGGSGTFPEVTGNQSAAANKLKSGPTEVQKPQEKPLKSNKIQEPPKASHQKKHILPLNQTSKPHKPP